MKRKHASPRGAVSKSQSVLITAWVPTPLAAAIQAAVLKHDTDRSKFLRRAVRAELDRLNQPAA